MACQVYRNSDGTITRVEAPNGQESLLYKSIQDFIPDPEDALRAWAQVYTSSFKQWFGDWERSVDSEDPGMDTVTRELLQTTNGVSKIVDENGEPLLVYHQSRTSNITSFDKSKIGDYLVQDRAEYGFYFTPNKHSSNFYGDNIYPVFLSISDPFIAENDYDSSVERRSGDGYMYTYDNGETVFTEIIAYEPSQIKSLLNNGEYNLDNNNIYFQQEEAPQQVPPSEQIDTQVQSFLEKIGVSVKSVDVIRDFQGNKLSAIAKADMLNKVIEVVKGAADISTLPEEAAHFFVEMLGPGHPLMKQMMTQITSYRMYPEVVNDYKNNKAYRNQDGTVNFDKIKKEAIGKMIAMNVIGKNGGYETDTKQNQFQTWFFKVWEFIKSVFKADIVKDNPFRYTAQKIVEGDTTDLDFNNIQGGEFYQLDTGESLRKLEEDQTKLTLDNSIDPVTKQKRHIYYYDGTQARGSVTSVYVDAWLKKIFRSDNREEAQKNVDLLKAEHGDVIHSEIESIIKSWTNPDGTIRDTQGPVAKLTSIGIYNKLNNFVVDVLSQYPEGTVIKTEVKVYDKKARVAGSIDFMAILPDGTVDILDYKSQEVAKDQTDLKTYKEPMYRIQLENYRKILELEYGFRKFGKIRAIPIKTSFVYNKGTIQSLKDIEVGSIDPTLIPDGKEYLLPVTIKNEKTGDEEVDELLKRLNGIYENISAQRYSKEELYKKREELGRLRDSLRDLQLRRKVDKLVDLGLLEYKKYAQKLKDKTLTGKDVIDARNILAVFNESDTLLWDMMKELQQEAKDSEDPNAIEKYNEVKDKFLSMTANTGKLVRDMEKYLSEIADNIAQQNGITGLLDPEAPVGVLNGTFSSLSKITQKSFRTLYGVLRSAQNTRDNKFDEDVAKLQELKSNMASWASSKGMSNETAMDMMLNIKDGKWNGNFLSIYQPEYYNKRKEAIAAGDVKWLTENTEYDQERYEKALKKQIEFFNSIQYKLDEKENSKLVQKKIEDWVKFHQVVNDNGSLNLQALSNPNNRFLTPNEKWYTDKWVELNKPENKPVKDVYDQFQQMNRRAEDLGMLDKYSPGFIPSVFASKVDQIVFGNVKGLFSGSGIFEDLQVDSGTKYSPEIDAITGEVINRIPVYMTRDIGVKDEKTGEIDYSKKSRDLFKVYGLWSAHMNNYEAMESIEDAALVLVEAERNKESLVTDRFDRIVIENGQVKSSKNNDKNADKLADFVNYYLYDKVGGKASDFSMKVLGKEYSLLKTVSSAMAFFSLKTLALNPMSGTAQFVGGTVNAMFAAKKGIMFTQKTWAQGVYFSTSRKALGASDYFNTKLEGNQSHSIADLSLSSTNQLLKKDNWYIIQRKSDAAVHSPVLVSMMLNHMIDENNNIVDIQKFVKNKYNYNTTYYNLPKDKRNEIKAKIDAEVKQLQDTKSLYAVGTVDAKGVFSLPGISKDSKTISDFRNKVKGTIKTIIGNSTRDDINHLRTTMLGTALSQFRSWIPAMVQERLEPLSYNNELDTYTYGRMRTFFGELFSKRFPIILKSIVTGFGNDAIQAGKDKYEELRRAAFEAGTDFTISEGEFIDLYLGNLRSELLELGVLIAFSGAVFAVAPGDDDDEKTKGLKKYLARGMKKYLQEVAFYYDPTEFTSLVKSPLPVIGLAEDMFRFTKHLSKEMVGAVANEDWQEEAKPAKYFFKMVPIAKEAMLIMATYDDDFRKEWDIKIQ